MLRTILTRSSPRYEQLKLVQMALAMKSGIKQERLKMKIDTDLLLNKSDWTTQEFNLMIDTIYSADKTIPVETLEDLGHENPQMLARILVYDILKINGVQERPPKFHTKIARDIDRYLQPEKYKTRIVNVGIIGDTNVGKRRIANNLLGVKTKAGRLMKLGSEFSYLEKNTVIDNKILNLTFHMWRMNPLDALLESKQYFYNTVDITFVVFDISNPVSFLNAIRSIEEIVKNNRTITPIALIGNKSDLRDVYNINSIPIEEETIQYYLQNLTNKLGLEIPYIEISSLEKKGRGLLIAYLTHFYEYIYYLRNYHEQKIVQKRLISKITNSIRRFSRNKLNIDTMISFMQRNLVKSP